MSSVPEPESSTVTANGIDLYLSTWKAQGTPPDDPKAIVVVYHGFLSHGRYPTVRYAAELLSAAGYTVLAPDMRGHGKSPGERGYIPNVQTLIDDAVAVAQHATTLCGTAVKKKKIFLMGSSMGGALSLHVAHELNQPGKDTTTVDGVILLAPMLALKVSPLARSLVGALAAVVPTLNAIPSSSTDPDKQYRDPQKRDECVHDELTIESKYLRVGSASTAVEMAATMQDKFETTTVPYICMVASQDVVVDPEGSRKFHQQSSSKDKTIKEYEALHGLLCEPEPLLTEIHKDLLDWINERSA